MKRAKHNLSKQRLFSGNMGKLIPIGWYPALPGDTIQQATAALIRTAPLVSPVMHTVRARIHHWFVPYRLLWDNWEEFITGADWESPNTFPTCTISHNPLFEGAGTLRDYMGLSNPAVSTTRSVNALPFRAYALIVNEWYRDQDLVAPMPISTANGVDSTTSTDQVFEPAWDKDYFSTARPFTSKGPEITIPISGTAPVTSDGTQPSITGLAGTPADGRGLRFGDANFVEYSGANVADNTASKWFNSGLEVDLDSITGQAELLELREAFAILRYQEARARYGSRYTEYLRYLGVRSSDARLQRPEFLGGGKQVIQFSEVLATAESENVEVGDLKGHGISGMRSNRFRRFIEEHGIVMSLMYVTPKTVYMQAADREWFKNTKEDYWQLELENIGDQEVTNKEVKFSHATPDGTFGYVPRYQEYRDQFSDVAGEFRTSELDYWHMGRDMSASDPTLNDTFVTLNPTDRIYAASAATSHQLYVMVNHSIQARRLVKQSGGSSYVR